MEAAKGILCHFLVIFRVKKVLNQQIVCGSTVNCDICPKSVKIDQVKIKKPVYSFEEAINILP